jgi:hypothetical protein
MKSPFTVAVVSLLLALPTHAAVVFQADFNGTGSGTGGPSDMVSFGGIGVLNNTNAKLSNVVASISSGTPLIAGGGRYLSLKDQGPSTRTRVVGAEFTPASAANSFDSWYVDASGTLGFDKLNGGFDFLFRTDSSAALDTNAYRFFDVNGGTSAYRFTLSSLSGGLTLVLTEAGVGIARATSSTVNFKANTTYRIAGTLSTDSRGYVTLNLYLAEGERIIDTNSSAYLIASATSRSVLDAGNKISSSFNSVAGISFGLIQNSSDDIKTFDLDSFRLYDDVPATFSSIRKSGDITKGTGGR